MTTSRENEEEQDDKEEKIPLAQARLSWPASIYGYHLQSTSNLLGGVWADLPATVTQTNGFNLATVAATGNSQFFRLVLPPQ